MGVESEGVGMNDLIIFGTGKIAQVLYYFLKKEHNIVAFTIDREAMDETRLFDLPVIAFEEIEEFLLPKRHSMLIAVGYHQMNGFREARFAEAKSKGYGSINYIHPSVDLHGNIEIGENNVVLDHVSLHPFVKIGDSNFIWSNAVIAHGCTIEDNCWITSGVTIAGDTTIKSNAFLGVNATIGHSITIERENFIGANTKISKDTKAKEVYISRDGEKSRLDSERFLQFAGV